jgi:vacuolar-type H+-ATPase subunit I/STV1
MNADSPIVEEVRKRRCELSERFGHDLRAYYEHLREVQDKYQTRLVSQITVVRSKNKK